MIARTVIIVVAALLIVAMTKLAAHRRRRQIAMASGADRVVLLTGPGCPRCQQQMRHLETLDAADRSRITIVDVAADPGAVDLSMVRSLPSTVVTVGEGQPTVLPGVIDADGLRTLLAQGVA